MIKELARLRRDRRGVTLVELLIATAIFTIVAVAIGSLYASTQRAFDYGSAQAYAQRQGTMIQEDLQRRLQRAVDFAVTGCGSATATASVRYSLPDGTDWCLHQDQKVGDTSPSSMSARSTRRFPSSAVDSPAAPPRSRASPARPRR